MEKYVFLMNIYVLLIYEPLLRQAMPNCMRVTYVFVSLYNH